MSRLQHLFWGEIVFAIHLSRPTLIAIMLISMAAISALNLSHQPTNEFTLQELKLAPLPKSYWRQWPTSNQTLWQAHWQQSANQEIIIIIRSNTHRTDRWQLNVDTWSRELTSLLQQPETQHKLRSVDHLGLAISGPLSESQLQWLLATFDHYLNDLTKDKPAALAWQAITEQSDPSFAIRTVDQADIGQTTANQDTFTQPDLPLPLCLGQGTQGKSMTAIPTDAPIALPTTRLTTTPTTTSIATSVTTPITNPLAATDLTTTDTLDVAHSLSAPSSAQSLVNWTTASWNQQRRQFARLLRYRWLEPSEQFDIQAELAYHRLAPNWINKLYLELANLSPKALIPWLNCELPS